MLNKNILLPIIEKIFFKAMTAGYANNGEGSVKNKTSDGYKIIEFTEDDFRVIDRYCVTPYSNYSAGTTTIFYENAPVWFMSYGGFYSEGVIPFLKSALGQTYQIGNFVGGRGPKEYLEGEFSYTNNAEENNFAKFKGREEISNKKTGELLGFHEYWGVGML